ncbi:hypothetical protein AKO1_015738 [Acrasis kona]|uniref:GCF C-terminal domain-containing protein n=1 Tax=Acrasis kona TaxID=1008807 RepID=A0AAW2ZIS1_9EUKA
MTGPKGTSKAMTTSKVLPELQYNIHQLVFMTEGAIKETDERVKSEGDAFAKLEKQQIISENTIKSETEKLQNLKQVQQIIQKCRDRYKSHSIELETIHEVFSTLKHKYASLWIPCQLDQFAMAIGGPKLFELINDWDGSDPLISTLTRWRNLTRTLKPITKRQEEIKTNILESHDDDEVNQIIYIDSEAYLILMHHMMNTLRPQLLMWDPLTSGHDHILDKIEKLHQVMPKDEMDSLIARTIIPRMCESLQNTTSLKLINAMHQWIHPWLPYIKSTTASTLGLYDLIKQFISRGLSHWDPLQPQENEMAISTILHWTDLIDMSTLIIPINIVPKLIYILKECFHVDPSDQDLNPLMAVVKWTKVIGVKSMCKLLQKHMFVKWIRTLYEWLTQIDFDYEQVMKWYYGWKNLLPPELSNHKIIKNVWKKGLDMMHQAANGQVITLGHVVDVDDDDDDHVVNRRDAKIVANEPKASFKDLIADYAAQMDLIFLPKGNQMAHGKQLYDFGGVTTFIDNDVLFVKDGASGLWKPVSLDEMMALQSNVK